MAAATGRSSAAQARLAQRLRREPSIEEVAVELGWKPQQVSQLDTIIQETMSLNAKMRDTNDRTELGDMVPDQRFDPAVSALDMTRRRDLAEAMARLLTERERRILRAYFGFDTGRQPTLDAVGAGEGLTRERVRQIIAGAMARLRDDPVIQAYGTSPVDG